MSEIENRAKRIWELIERAQDVPEGERDEFLVAASQGDHDLLAQLRAAFDGSDFVDTSDDLVNRGASRPTHSTPVSFAGRTIGEKYELIEEIGRGAMGTVYRARHCQLDQQFAVKVMLDDGDLEGVLREGRRLAEVDHRAVVQVVDVGTFEGAPYLVMEWLDGFDLASWLRACESMPNGVSLEDGLRSVAEERGASTTEAFTSYWRFIATLMRDVARAVARAHELGVAHQDISPKNILVVDGGFPALIDFGLAATLPDIHAGAEASPRGGTAPYMAPEHRRATGSASLVGNDVYGLGATLLHLITGVRPDRLSLTPLGMRGVRRFADRKDRGSEIPRDLLLIGWQATRRDPAERFQSAAAFAEELDRFLAFKPLAIAPPNAARALRLWWKRSPPRAGLTLLAPSFLAVAGWVGHSAIQDVRIAHASESRTAVLERFATLPPYFAIPGRLDVPVDMDPPIHDDTVRQLDAILEIEPDLDSLRWRRVLASARRGEHRRTLDDLAVLRSRHGDSQILGVLAPLVLDPDPQIRHALQDPSTLPEPRSALDHGILATLFHQARGMVAASGGARAAAQPVLHHASKALLLDPDDFVTRELLVVKALINDPDFAFLEEHRAALNQQLEGHPTAGLLHAMGFGADVSSQLELYKRSVELCPYQFNARHNLAEIQVDAGQGENALAELIRLHGERPYATNTIQLVARVHREGARIEQADRWLESLREQWNEVGVDTGALEGVIAAHTAQAFFIGLDESTPPGGSLAQWPRSAELDGPAIRACAVLSLFLSKQIDRESAIEELTLLHLEALGHPERSEAAFSAEALLRALLRPTLPTGGPPDLSDAETALAYECGRCIQEDYDVHVRTYPLLLSLPRRPSTTLAPAPR